MEFIIPEFQGVKLQQKNIHAYLGSSDLCAEVHLSKIHFKPEDEKLFDQLLSSVRLLPDELSSAENPSQAGQLDPAQPYFKEGSRLYLQHDYTAAAASEYQKALDLEKQKRTLPRDYFLVLVDNLSMAYGISGNLSQAKATFEYGLTQDAEYPMFYYNLACTYGR